MKVAVYARVSSADQAAGTSIESQIAECHAWAGRNGVPIAEDFVDAGESAKTSNRPAFLRMIAAARSKAFDVVLVHKLDRFARDSHDFCVTRALLAGYGVQIMSVTEPSTDDPAGRFLQTILSAVAQLDNEVRAERSRSGMVARAQAGFWCHKPPIGFTLRQTPNGAVLDPHPQDAPHVVKLFEGLASGMIAPELAPQTLAESLGRPIRTHHVRLVVTQRAYRGQICSQLTEGRVVEAQWPPMVDPETWNLANAAFARVHRAEGRGDAREWPLRQWMVCAECHRPLTGSTTRTRYGAWGYYHCPKGHVRIRRDVAHGRMAELLTSITSRARKTIAVLRALTKAAMVEERGRNRDISDRQRQVIAGLQTQQDRLLEALVTGTVDNATYRVKAAQIATQKAAAWEIVSSADSGQIDTDAALDLCTTFFGQIGQLWVTAAPEHQHLLMKALVGTPMVVTRAKTVTTSLESSVINILDGISGETAGWHPIPVLSYNQIIALLAPLRKLMEAA